MAILKKFCFLALFLVLVPAIVIGDNPITPFLEAICKQVECGEGTCRVDIGKPLGFVCECKSGWVRSPDDDINNKLQFLPCVYPKCTLNYDRCQPPPPPVPEKDVPFNISFYDPCYWMFCGEGTCTKNSTYNHLCSCKSGFSNLLDVPYYPCYSECTIGSDCASLGIKVSNSKSSPATPANPASSILPGKFQRMIILLVPILLALRK